MPREIRTVVRGDTGRLLNPQLVAVGEAGVAVLDFADDAVVHMLDRQGHSLARVALRSHGIDTPTDLRWQGNAVIVADGRSGRIATIGLDGRVLNVVTLQYPMKQVIPRGTNGWLGFDETKAHRLFDFTFDSSGRVLDSMALSAAWQGMAPLLRESWVTSVPGAGDQVVRTFRHRAELELCDLVRHQCAVIRGVEPVGSPRTVEWRVSELMRIVRADPTVPDAALSIAVDRRFAYVLFRGSTAHAGRLVDVYGLRERSYVGSIRLPDAAIAIAEYKGLFAALLEAREAVPPRLITFRLAPQ
ncbi:MAG: hypothetical protein AAB092_09935 [Chloroflexota bacterium]